MHSVDPFDNSPSQKVAQEPNPSSWIFDVLLLGALFLASEPLLQLGYAAGLDEAPWRETTELAVLFLVLYVAHLVGLFLKTGPLSRRIHRRSAPGVTLNGRLENWLLGPDDGLLKVLLLPLIGQFVLWLTCLGVVFDVFGLMQPGPGGAVVGLLILVLAALPCWPVWRLLSVDGGTKPPFPELPASRLLEPLGDLLLALSAIILLIPLLTMTEALSQELVLSDLPPGAWIGLIIAAAIVTSVFYAAPRLPHLIEELPRWQFWLRTLLGVAALFTGLTIFLI